MIEKIFPVLFVFLILLFFWISVIFVVSRLTVPLLRRKRVSVPEKIPEKMKEKIDKLKKSSKNRRDFLEKSYKFLTKKYHGGRIMTLIRSDMLFLMNLEKIWKMNGYIPCTTHNYLMRIFLVKSGLFNEFDIKLKHTFVNFNIHQYLRVRVDNDWIDVDPAGDYFSVPFGKHTFFLN